jgi:hypothetical protein
MLEAHNDEPVIITGAQLLEAYSSTGVHEFAGVTVFGPFEEGGVKVMVDAGSKFVVVGTDEQYVHLNIGGSHIRIPKKAFLSVKVTE